MMHDIINQLHSLNFPLNPPASSTEIAKLEQFIGVPLPADLKQLYLDHNGMIDLRAEQDEDRELWCRLLSIDELVETLTEMSKEWFVDHPDLLAMFLPCWTDDNSNYAGIYTDGPLKFHIALLEHEIGDVLELSFRDIQSFYRAMLANYSGITSTGHDYPKWKPQPGYDVAEGALFDYYLTLYRQEQDSRRRLCYAYNAVALCPFARTSELYEFLEGTDFNELERIICWTFVIRAWEDAIPIIGRLIHKDGQDHLTIPIHALGQTPYSAAADELISATSQLHPYKLSFITDALKQHGYSIRTITRGNGKYDTYEVKSPTATEWIAIRGYEVNSQSDSG